MPPATISISFKELYVPNAADSDQRLPLSALGGNNDHVHGELRIEIAGRSLPYLGYFGPDDVCFNDWARELSRAVDRLHGEDPAKHVFDEDEQGQPAFEFRREGETVFVSIVDSAIGDGCADAAWQRVPCDLADFVAAVRAFTSDLRTAIEDGAPPDVAARWCKCIGPTRV